MKYTVTYKPSAEHELANLWLNAVRRQAVADAANRIDVNLATDPFAHGESRENQIRILFERPLALLFEVREEDRLIEVLKVWWVGK